MQKTARPRRIPVATPRILTACGYLYVHIGYVDGRVMEIRASLGKGGGCAACQLEAMTRSLTLGLRYGVPLKEYIQQLENIKCGVETVDHQAGTKAKSCADAIATAIKEELNESSFTGGSTATGDSAGPGYPAGEGVRALPCV